MLWFVTEWIQTHWREKWGDISWCSEAHHRVVDMVPAQGWLDPGALAFQSVWLPLSLGNPPASILLHPYLSLFSFTLSFKEQTVFMWQGLCDRGPRFWCFQIHNPVDKLGLSLSPSVGISWWKACIGCAWVMCHLDGWGWRCGTGSMCGRNWG